ncbi:MAG: PorT family protein [Candidatus Azobacteroides sp.]|nr:PorT family protein [Candidatus Azobacteroides sp.]
MGRIISFLICLFFLPAFTYSQLSIKLTAGWNISSITEINGSKSKLGYTIGPAISYEFKENFGLETGLFISTKGVKVPFSFVESLENTGSEKEITVNANYLEISLMVKSYFYNNGVIAFYLGVGPYFSYGFGGKTSFEDDLFESLDTFDSPSVLKRFDVGALLAFGWDIDRMSFDLSYQQGLSSVKGDLYYVNDNSKTRSFWFNVGYKL